MSPLRNDSLLRRLIRSAGSVWTGTVLLGAVAVYVGVASVGREWMYAHWSLAALCGLTCASLLVATVTRVRFDLARAGAWASHLGLIVLAAGSLWYARRHVSGDCMILRQGEDWGAVDRFHLPRFAVYVGPGHAAEQGAGAGEPRQTELPVDTRSIPDRAAIDVPLAGGPEGVKCRAVAFRGSAVIADVARVRLADPAGGGSRHLTLGPQSPLVAADYMVLYHPSISPQRLERILHPSPGDPDLRLERDAVLVFTGSAVEPTVVVIRPDGSRWHAALPVGRDVELPVAGRKLAFCVLGFATEALPAEHAPHGMAQPAGPAVRVELSAADWKGDVWVPFFTYSGLMPPTCAALPDGRAVDLAFSRRSLPLGAELKVRSAEFVTYPGSAKAMDYRCAADVTAGAKRRRVVISLNNPLRIGPYQLFQNSWQPDGPNVSRIILGVASRPGLPVIWTGCALICLGLPYAFYVKPLILRRRKRP